jgi:DNA-binding transcriptional LysR family regulator
MDPAVKYSSLHVFITVAETGNIVAAADKLGRTPSAISMALKQLEVAIGGALFEGDRKSKLTALGRHVLDSARLELLCFDRAISSMRAFARNHIGRVDIASVPSIAHHFLPQAIKTFVADRPEVELELRDADTTTIVSLVARGQVDFGIGGRPPFNSQLSFESLIADKFVVLCRRDSPLGRHHGAVELSELKRETLIANGASDRVQSLQLDFFNSKLKVWNVISLVSLVRSGVGITILPELSALASDPSVKRVRLLHEGRPITREVGLMSRKRSSLTPAAKAFCDHLKQLISREAGSSGGNSSLRDITVLGAAGPT